MIPSTVYSQLRQGANKLAQLSAQEKNAALESVIKSINAQRARILAANEHDIVKELDKGTKESLIDRLRLTESRINGIINSIETIINQTDPIGQTLSGWKTPNGLDIKQIRVPLGVTAIIYESRPNVTVDAFALAYKSGNAILLRGSSSALESNMAIVSAIKAGLRDAPNHCGVPEAIELATGGHEEVTEILTARGNIDVVLPRGSAKLIKMVVENAKVPVIETGSGVCHLYVDETADLDKAAAIAENGKLQRPGVCNALETIVINKQILPQFTEKLLTVFKGRAEIRCDEKSFSLFMDTEKKVQSKAVIKAATSEDFGYEFLDNIVTIKTVENISEAIDYINTHNTKHSESIITNSVANANQFQKEIDAACVYVNASTRFTDGEEFGFGAELGISTQKMHIRGPMGLTALTTIKYVINGEGQIR
jgi:glutamate-5-semialdehyde dehydrogenase